MLSFLAAAGLTTVLATAGMQTDTTVTVRPGARLEIENFGGSIAIKAWDKNAVRVEASHSRRTYVQVEADRSTVRIEALGRMRVPRRFRAHIDVIADAPIEGQIATAEWLEAKVRALRGDAA